MAKLPNALVLFCAVLLATAGVAGIIKFRTSVTGIAFHVVVLLCAGYLVVSVRRRA